MLVEKLSEIIFCSIRKNTQFAFGYLCDRSGSKREFFLSLIYEHKIFELHFFLGKTALGAAPEKVNDLSCSILTDIGIYFAFYTCIALSIWCNAQDAANLLNLSPSGKLFMRENSIKKNNVKSPLNIIETLTKKFFFVWRAEILARKRRLKRKAWSETVSTTDNSILPRVVIDSIIVELIVFVPMSSLISVIENGINLSAMDWIGWYWPEYTCILNKWQRRIWNGLLNLSVYILINRTQSISISCVLFYVFRIIALLRIHNEYKYTCFTRSKTRNSNYHQFCNTDTTWTIKDEWN